MTRHTNERGQTERCLLAGPNPHSLFWTKRATESNTVSHMQAAKQDIVTSMVLYKCSVTMADIRDSWLGFACKDVSANNLMINRFDDSLYYF